MLRQLLNELIRPLGLRMVRPDFQWGVDVLSDVRRLARSQKWKIKTVIDVGAHFGEWADYALRRLPDASLISFEPSPESFSELKRRLNEG